MLKTESSRGRAGPLIQDLSISEEEPDAIAQQTIAADTSKAKSAPPQDEGPTMLELMMAAQAEAKKEKVVEAKAEEVKTTKSFGGGFKKGFLGGGASKPSKESKVSSSSSATINSASKESIPTIKKNPTAAAPSSITKDVQDAMANDTNPMLQKLQQGGITSPN
jgi:hypothetical protein